MPEGKNGLFLIKSIAPNVVRGFDDARSEAPDVLGEAPCAVGEAPDNRENTPHVIRGSPSYVRGITEHSRGFTLRISEAPDDVRGFTFI